MDQKEPSKSHSDRLAAFQEAIRNLERFTELNKNEEVLNIQQLDVQSGELVTTPVSGLKKTVELFSSIFSRNPEKHRRRLKVEKKLLDSIAYLKTHWRVIDKLRQGGPEEQKLADWAMETIQEYNTLLKRSESTSPKLVDRVFKTIYEQSGMSIGEELKENPIEPPRDISVYFHSSQKQQRREESNFTMHKIATFLQQHGMLVSMPTSMEIDFFHMKSITLSKSSDVPKSVRKDLMQWMRKIPIRSTITTKEEGEAGHTTSVIHLKQTLTPFPGEVITIEGKFKRDTASSVPSVPLNDSFHVTTKAVQTGYPHPSQHTGWALSKSLIPEQANRLSLLPTLKPLVEQMNLVAQDLLPEGTLNQLAKHLLLLKKEAFADHCQEFLENHRLLNMALMEASFYEEEDPQVIDRFYEMLSHDATPYETLSRAYHYLNTLFIDNPYEALKKEWHEEANPSLCEGKAKEKYKSACAIYEKGIEDSYNHIAEELDHVQRDVERYTIPWLMVMGKILGKAGEAIVLQHMSEKIGFAPPMLSRFERNLQRCAFHHLISFVTELEANRIGKPSAEGTYQIMKKNLQEEILIFGKQEEGRQIGLPSIIVEELELYYNTQHFGSGY